MTPEALAEVIASALDNLHDDEAGLFYSAAASGPGRVRVTVRDAVGIAGPVGLLVDVYPPFPKEVRA